MNASRIPGAAVLAGASCLLLATAANAQPDPLGSSLFLFPGFHPNPATSASASLAMSDRWLGEDAFDNPAVAPRGRVVVSPLIQRINRQDLRADNRDFDETSAFLDGAGLQVVVPIGGVALSVYAAQPILRLEEVAFTRGLVAEPVPPAYIGAETSTREQRIGAGVASRLGGFRLGVAAEYTRRDDRYLAREESGAPTTGTQEVSFEGDGFGMQAGLRGSWPELGPLQRTTLGVAARMVPELTLEGSVDLDQLLGASSTPIAAVREAAYEGGLSFATYVTRTFQVFLGGGGRTAQDWQGFGVTSGRQAMGSVGGEFHDPESPWWFRFGIGMEQQDGSQEPHAGIVGLGVDWKEESLLIGVGIVRRSFKRGDAPTSFDNRVVVSVGLDL